jgi:serine/threonine protein kinase
MEVLAQHKFCETCGSSVELEMPSGFCPACLLTTALERSQTMAAGSCIEDYELLNEVARGGMGIVYRARQRAPSRVVALKMILPTHLSSLGAVQRFRAEAETAASLEHENILPIYAVGQQGGAPFFSMKFADGGTLSARIDNYRDKPREAAALVAKLACAVAFAHEHGILHRDLKPGNVLFDSAGKPYVSDFGLAKWLQRECDLTQTLAILGTPYYMAPEQATDSRGVTATADVYSLGAILYHLLAGRPPIWGETPMEVLHRAAAEKPKSPRLTNPRVSRDLETICLKCLEKEPGARYMSAAALADDLERFCAGHTIQARPVGLANRAWRWTRRNPVVAGLIGVSLALLAALGGIVWKSKFISHPVTNGVAVLPFENLSADPGNAYFADGIQEEILTRLVSIAGLKVISRTSTQQYQSKPRNLREIAKQLGVANIVEGSVQKAADQVRVNVQLVNAQTDSHLWADTYYRKLTDIFWIESQIAKRIAESLQAKISGREEQALAVEPTNNPEAYDAYLRGLDFEARSGPSRSNDLLGKASRFFERAVQLDPNFALAWARLSRTDARLYFNLVHTTASRDAAKSALENAQKLEPNSPETLLAFGYYQYWVLRDYWLAKTTFELARKVLPGSSEIPTAIGRIARREGQWGQSIAYFEQALALDPRNLALLNDTAETYAMLRQFPTALKVYDRALDVTPNDPGVMAAKAGIYQAEGNLREAASFLSRISAETLAAGETLQIKLNQLRLERNYDQAVRLLQTRQAQFHFDSQYDQANEQMNLALMQRLAGDTAGAKVTAEQARSTLQQLDRDQPGNWDLVANLSEAHTVIGEKDLALKEAERAVLLYPRAKDAVHGPALEENLALIQMMIGENSRAISTLAELLQTPSQTGLYGLTPITPALLRLDPLWDPLRDDPAFQKLCEEKQQ